MQQQQHPNQFQMRDTISCHHAQDNGRRRPCNPFTYIGLVAILTYLCACDLSLLVSAAAGTVSVALLSPRFVSSGSASNASCLAQYQVASPLNATQLAINQYNAAAALSSTSSASVNSFVIEFGSSSNAPSAADYAAAAADALNQGAHILFDVFGYADADIRSSIASTLDSKSQLLWSPRSSSEECYSAIFSTGSTPNVVHAPAIAYFVTRYPAAYYYTLTPSSVSKPVVNARGNDTTNIMMEQLRWSGGTLLGSASLNLDLSTTEQGNTLASILSDVRNKVTSAVANALANGATSSSSFQVVILSALPVLSQNLLLEAMVNSAMSQVAGYEVLAFEYDEAQAAQLYCAIGSSGSALKVTSASAYFDRVSNNASATFRSAYANTYGIANPVFTDSTIASLNSVLFFLNALSDSSDTSLVSLASSMRSSQIQSPEGTIRMNLHQHVSRYLRIAKFNLASASDTTLLFESQHLKRSQVWNSYIPSSFGFDCDWSDPMARGEKYKIDYVKVGVLHSVTGALAFSERSVVDAELMAIDEINESGGVLGKQILPVFYDGQTNWDNFAAKAELLCADVDITSVFGCWTSVSRKYVLPVFERTDKLLWYPVQYEGQECSKNVFYTGAAPNQQIEPSLDWLLRNKPNFKSYFLVGSDYVFPRTANAVIKSYLATLQRATKIVNEMYIPLSGITYVQIEQMVDTILSTILTSMPEGGVIYNTLNGDSNIVFFRKMALLGMTAAKYPTMSVSIAESEIDAIGASYLLGHYASWNYFQSVGSPDGSGRFTITDDSQAPSANALFVSNFQSRFGTDRVLNDPMEAAYIGVNVWRQAAEQARVIDVATVRDAAYGQVFDAPEGLVVMNSNHHLSKSVRIGRVNVYGQFDIVSDTEASVKPLPWNQFINTTQGRACDWSPSVNQAFYAYPAVEIALLSSFQDPFTQEERVALDAFQLAIQQTNNRGSVLGNNIVDQRVMDDTGDFNLAATNLLHALDDPSIAAVFVSSPAVHSLLSLDTTDITDSSSSAVATRTLAAQVQQRVAASSKLVSLTRANSATAGMCSENLLFNGATLNQLVEPALQHLVESGQSEFVLLLPDATAASSNGLQLNPAHVLHFVTSLFQTYNATIRAVNLDTVIVPSTADATSISAQIRGMVGKHPVKANLLNFLPLAQSALLFSSVYSIGLKTASYPILSFTLDAAGVRSMVASSSFGERLFTGHSFALTYTLQPNSRDAQDLATSLLEQHGSSDADITPLVDSAYGSVSAWGEAVRQSSSAEAEHVRQQAYIASSEARQSSVSGTSLYASLRSSNHVGKYFYIAKLGRNSAFQVLYPTNGASLFLEPDPQRFAATTLLLRSCEFGPVSVLLSYPHTLKSINYALSGLIGTFLLVCMGVTKYYENTPVIRQISPTFCLLSQTSILFLVFSGIVFSIEPSSTNGICGARVWLPALAVSTLCSFLFAKMWRLKRIFNNVKMQTISLPNKKLLQYCAIANAPTILIMILWSAIDPPSYYSVLSTTDSTFNQISFIPVCSQSTTFFALLCAYIVFVLSYGLLIAFQTRSVSERFNEGRYVTFSVILILFFGIMLVPLNYLLDAATQTLASAATLIVIRSIGALFAALAIALTLFLPFFVQLHETIVLNTKYGNITKDGDLTRAPTKYASQNYSVPPGSGGSSDEQQASALPSPGGRKARVGWNNSAPTVQVSAAGASPAMEHNILVNIPPSPANHANLLLTPPPNNVTLSSMNMKRQTLKERKSSSGSAGPNLAIESDLPQPMHASQVIPEESTPVPSPSDATAADQTESVKMHVSPAPSADTVITLPHQSEVDSVVS